MPGDFLDTNVLIYAASRDDAKVGVAEAWIRRGGTISVQVLNEFVSVARRKMHFSWEEVRSFLDDARFVLEIQPIDVATHDEAIRIAERYRVAWYDAVIVASALSAGCDRLITEDLHAGMVIDGHLTVVNPFAPAA